MQMQAAAAERQQRVSATHGDGTSTPGQRRRSKASVLWRTPCTLHRSAGPGSIRSMHCTLSLSLGRRAAERAQRRKERQQRGAAEGRTSLGDIDGLDSVDLTHVVCVIAQGRLGTTICPRVALLPPSFLPFPLAADAETLTEGLPSQTTSKNIALEHTRREAAGRCA